jgi:hypothetical protein
LSIHRVREAIASGVYVFSHIPGENNPADILSKHWGYSSVWHMLKILLYVKGDTSGSPGKDEREKETTKVTGPSVASYSTSMCHIRPHKWENVNGNAYIGFDLALSGCMVLQELTKSGGGEKRKKFGCSSGSGSDKDLALPAYVPMHDRYVTSIDDTDDVYMKNNMCKLGQSGVQETTHRES